MPVPNAFEYGIHIIDDIFVAYIDFLLLITILLVSVTLSANHSARLFNYRCFRESTPSYAVS